MVRYVESCGRGPMPAVAVRLGRRRLPESLHSVDFVDGRNIPVPDIGRLGVGRSALSDDHVSYLGRCGRLRRADN